MSATKTYRVYGTIGKSQEESFLKSKYWDWSKPGDIHILDVRNFDLTLTHAYTEIAITRNTEQECDDELEAQISDGLFVYAAVGKVQTVHYYDSYKVEQLWKMLRAEATAPDDQKYGAHLTHWSGDAKPINIDEGAIRALIRYYTMACMNFHSTKSEEKRESVCL